MILEHLPPVLGEKKKNHSYANKDVKQMNKDVSKGNKIQLDIANNIYNFHRWNTRKQCQ